MAVPEHVADAAAASGNAAPWPPAALERVRQCPLCGTAERAELHRSLRDATAAAAPGTWTLYRCAGCRSAYLDPRPSAESVDRAYRRYYTHREPTVQPRPETRLGRFRRALRNGYVNARYGYSFEPASPLGPLAMRLFPLRRQEADRWVRHLRLPAAPSRLLDVGCGNGAFLLQMKETGWSVRGIDPDPRAVAQVRAAGIAAEQGVLADDTYPTDHFDAITIDHVIEHAPDPLELLRACRRCLRPGGMLWLATPNLASRGRAVFGRDWRGLDPPRHFVLFAPDALEGALGRTGFELLARPAVCTARWGFRASSAVARGLDPDNCPPPAPWRLRASAWLADRRGLRRSEHAEEIVLLARKPIA